MAGLISPATRGKKIKGKKRHLLVDTQGLLLRAVVHAADIQDRDGGTLLIAPLSDRLSTLRKLYAGGGYPRPRFSDELKKTRAHIDLEIVKPSPLPPD